MFDICYNMSDGHNNPFRSYQTVGIQSPYKPPRKCVGFQQSKRVMTIKLSKLWRDNTNTQGKCYASEVQHIDEPNPGHL